MSTTLTPEGRTTLATMLDPVIARLVSAKDTWVHTGIPERIDLLRQANAGVREIADEWVRLAAQVKGLDLHSPLIGEEWISGPMTTIRNMRLMVEALKEGGAPKPVSVRTRANGQVVARVFPRTWLEQAVYSGMRVEVWIEPGKPATQGRIYREKAQGVFSPGRVCCVLGAGNVSSIGPLDVIYKLYVEDEVCVLKMNPVNEYLAPLFTRAFAGLIDRGFMQVVTGGIDAGDYLCTHPAVDTIHLTGSDRTHDAIVWGATREEQEERKRLGRPRVNKKITSELGSVTPVMVVPSAWTEGSLDFHARNVAAMVAHNASFNCNAAKVLVMARGWAHREAFLDKLHEVFARLAPRNAYYPGAEDRYRAFREQYPNARVLGQSGPGVVPWTVLPNVPPDAGEYALTREAFCGVLAEVSLDVSDAASFLREAVTFANEHVWGTLSCMMIIDLRTRAKHRERFEAALENLRYGGIGVNVWPGANFALGEPSWGAFPGNALDNIGSGIGVVHNSMLYDHPQKSIVYGPFRMFPTPVWFADHKTLHTLGRLATMFEADPTWSKLPRIALTGVRG